MNKAIGNIAFGAFCIVGGLSKKFVLAGIESSNGLILLGVVFISLAFADAVKSRASSTEASFIDPILDFWFIPVRAERLLLFQRIFTLTFFIYLLGWTSSATEWLTVEGFHLSPNATSRAYPAPFAALPVAWLVPFLIVLFSTTWAVILDVGGRVAKALLLGFAVYVQMVDQPSSFTLNKLYVVFFAFILVAPASVTAHDGSRWHAAWAVRMVQATILIQYCTAGICKTLWGDWTYNPMVLYTHTVGIYRTDIAALVVEYTPAFMWVIFAWSALLFELLAPIFFIGRRLRTIACVWGATFHIGVAVLMKDLIFFTQQMISTYVLFLDDKYVVRVESRIAAFVSPIATPINALTDRIFAPLFERFGTSEAVVVAPPVDEETGSEKSKAAS